VKPVRENDDRLLEIGGGWLRPYRHPQAGDRDGMFRRLRAAERNQQHRRRNREESHDGHSV
jgi:hypothetical protein